MTGPGFSPAGQPAASGLASRKKPQALLIVRHTAALSLEPRSVSVAQFADRLFEVGMKPTDQPADLSDIRCRSFRILRHSHQSLRDSARQRCVRLANLANCCVALWRANRQEGWRHVVRRPLRAYIILLLGAI